MQRRKINPYLITIIVAILLSVFGLLINKAFSRETKLETYGAFSNGFFLAGVLIFSFGILVIASNGGAFDMLVYGTKRFISLFRKNVHEIKYPTYYDYREAMKERKRSYLHLIVVGGVLIIISIVFVILWKNAQ